MFARVAMYHGADAAAIDALLEQLGAQVEAQFNAPPAGLEGLREFLLLVDREHGRGLGISLFGTEEELRSGDAALDRVPLSQAGGVRTGVERYELVLRRARPER
jgi:hypothetical protein